MPFQITAPQSPRRDSPSLRRTGRQRVLEACLRRAALLCPWPQRQTTLRKRTLLGLRPENLPTVRNDQATILADCRRDLADDAARLTVRKLHEQVPLLGTSAGLGLLRLVTHSHRLLVALFEICELSMGGLGPWMRVTPNVKAVDGR